MRTRQPPIIRSWLQLLMDIRGWKLTGMAQNPHPPRVVNGELPCGASAELTLTTIGGGPDPRLIELVRVLARRAARQAFEQETRQGSSC